MQRALVVFAGFAQTDDAKDGTPAANDAFPSLGEAAKEEDASSFPTLGAAATEGIFRVPGDAVACPATRFCSGRWARSSSRAS